MSKQISKSNQIKDGPTLSEILRNNQRWASETKERDPAFFERSATQQHPKYLWIGCSDSRVPVSQITGTAPGEVFVHRNVANIVQAEDPSCQSVLEFAVLGLQVEHIVICGHYKCGGVHAAIQGTATGKVASWIEGIAQLYASKRKSLEKLPDEARLKALCELNVGMQLASLASSPSVQQVWSQGRALDLHGLIYDLETGLLKDLGMSLRGPQDLAADLL